MSYLATLARPAEVPKQPVVEMAPAPRAERFGEVHEEVVAARDELGSEATHPASVRPVASSVVHDIAAFVEPSTTAVESTSRQPAPQDPLPTKAVRAAPATPVVAPPRVAPASEEASKSTIDMTLTREATSPVGRRVMASSAAVRALAEPVALDVSTPREPISRGADHGPAGNEPMLESTAALQRSPMTPLVRSVEHADKLSVRGTPAPTTRPTVNVHIGAISLTVKAPATAAPVPTPAAAPVAPPPAAAATPRSREGLGFSASRHYLRWN